MDSLEAVQREFGFSSLTGEIECVDIHSIEDARPLYEDSCRELAAAFKDGNLERCEFAARNITILEEVFPGLVVLHDTEELAQTD